MRTVLILSILVAACGGSKTPPKEADTSSLESDGGTSEPTSETPDAGSADKPVAANACAGFELDLMKVLSQAACELEKPTAQSKDLKGQLEVKVVPSSPKVAPGGKLDVTVVFHNKGKSDLPLEFVVDPEPYFSFEVWNEKGQRVDAPAGDAPSLPSSVGAAPDKKAARATLVTNGKGEVKLTWEANKLKWAPKDKVKGAVPGRGYPTVAAGPLPKGKYTLKVITPLTGVFEGVDHEMSQPRVQIEVN
jgi:hypothetical protein